MELYICEKPSQAKDLAKYLGTISRESSCIKCRNATQVTWAYGHMLEQYMPEDYDPELKAWNLDSLPLTPDPWKLKVKQSASKQYNAVCKQIKQASCVWIATDYDREGELIARELIEAAGYSGPLKRVPLRGLDQHSIKVAFERSMEGDKTHALYMAGLARMRADWLVGMNLTRLYTCLLQAAGVRQTLQIGRVLTPVVALVCRRDQEIDNFTPSPFYDIEATISAPGGHFKAKWIPPETESDEKGRCLSRDFATRVAREVNGAQGKLARVDVEHKTTSAPLPFDLSSLQQYGSKKWGYTADQILSAAQSLYETHKATTYPRTDSRYIPESQLSEAPLVLEALSTSDPDFQVVLKSVNMDEAPRSFNDSKVGAHHAIIPTLEAADISKMSESEFNIYDAVRRSYIAQFMPPAKDEKTTVDTVVASASQPLFRTKGKVEKDPGWRVAFQESDDETEADAEEEQGQLPVVAQGEACAVTESNIKDKKTTPPSRFTDASLLAAMENAARFEPDERFKAILKETAGLGTSATRAQIIEGAIKKGYLQRSKKQIRATAKARGIVDFVPKAVSGTGMTAAWEQELEKIAGGERTLEEFMSELQRWIEKMVEKVKASSVSSSISQASMEQFKEHAKGTPCPSCKEGEVIKINGKYGKFWKCKDSSCGKTFDDNRGKPRKTKRKRKTSSSASA